MLTSAQSAVVIRMLDYFGYNYRRSRISNYIVLDRIRPIIDRGQKIKLSPEQITATHRNDLVGQIIDGDLGSRWGSGVPQSPGMVIEIDLDSKTEISGMTIDLGLWLSDAPKGLIVEGQNEEGDYCTIVDIQRAQDYELGRAWDFYFKPKRFRKLRLIQSGSHPILDWSIAELSLYGVSSDLKEIPHVAN